MDKSFNKREGKSVFLNIMLDIASLKSEILQNEGLSFDKALALTELQAADEIENLVSLADEVRRAFCGDEVDLCSIINARSGRCTEDCAFCSQSSHYRTEVPIYPLKSCSEILTAALQAQAQGAHRFCIVTSGKSLNSREFKQVLEALQAISQATGLKRCASLGSLTEAQAFELKAAGLQRYHHNLECAESFYPRICTTHTYTQRVQTVKAVKAAGLEVCCGGILNLGETPQQRIEFIFELKALNPDSVPINFLNPRPGTPLADRILISSLEALKYIALFRLVMPRALIRLAGGRCENLQNNYEQGLKAGINGLLIGNYLTTEGPAASQDIEILNKLGLKTGAAVG
jgi:biotin synthase